MPGAHQASAAFTIPPKGTSMQIPVYLTNHWVDTHAGIWQFVNNPIRATFSIQYDQTTTPASPSGFITGTFLSMPGDSDPGTVVPLDTNAVAYVSMPKSLSQLINPSLAVISPYMPQSGCPALFQQALILTGKVYALKAAGGTDYRTNPVQLIADATASELGATADELQATQVSVWLQAMTGGASPTISSSGVPPATASAALALQAAKTFIKYDASTLYLVDTYITALLVKQIFSP